MSGRELDEYELEVALDSKYSIQSEQLIQSFGIITTAAGAVGVTAAVVGTATRVSAGTTGGVGSMLNPARFWFLVEVMQIVNLMVFITLPIPDILR